MFELQAILVFMIIAAVVTVELKDLLSSVIALGAIGLGLSLAFLLLKAPDLAIVQLVVEIMALIVLIRATIRKDIPAIRNGHNILLWFVAIIFIAIFLKTASLALRQFPQFGQPVMTVAKEYLDIGLKSTGAPNIVTSIILDFRAYDTLGEATILFASVIGVLTVLRKIGRKKDE